MFQVSAMTPAPKLYLLTNDDEFALLYAKLEAALATGLVALLQIRRKKPYNRQMAKKNSMRKRSR